MLEGLEELVDGGACRWSRPVVVGQHPSHRSMHSMVPVELELGETAEDAEVRSLLVVFGGWSGPGGRFLNDLHALDVNTLEWTELRPEGDVPEPRGGHAACCVGTDLYVFGGANDVEQSGQSTPAYPHSSRCPLSAPSTMVSGQPNLAFEHLTFRASTFRST